MPIFSNFSATSYPVVAESAIDEVAALSAPENIQYFYIVLKKVFLKYWLGGFFFYKWLEIFISKGFSEILEF